MTKLLAIDDEIEFVDMIRNYFEPRGYNVWTANDGDAGLEIATAQHPDVALVDLKMPGKHGDAVLRELRVVSPGTRVIMITALESEGLLREKLLSMGAAACFDKPLTSLKMLEHTVKDILKS